MVGRTYQQTSKSYSPEAKNKSAKNTSSAPKDISQIVRFLTNTFNAAVHRLNVDRPARTKKGANTAYQLQTEFAYLLNEVMQGPQGLLQKHIADCNNFIDEVLQMNTK
ncbi:MAG: hypothetical protein ACXW0J_02510 [Nitrososphaeraceae archaeon]